MQPLQNAKFRTSTRVANCSIAATLCVICMAYIRIQFITSYNAVLSKLVSKPKSQFNLPRFKPVHIASHQRFQNTTWLKFRENSPVRGKQKRGYRGKDLKKRCFKTRLEKIVAWTLINHSLSTSSFRCMQAMQSKQVRLCVCVCACLSICTRSLLIRK